MKTDLPAASDKAVINPSQNARSLPTLRLQMALDAAQRLARGERIKQLREESPYTQPVLAEQVGVTLRAYQRWEEGGGIEWDHLEKLAEIHGVDVQWIHKGEEQGVTPDVLATLNGADDIRSELGRLVEAVARMDETISELRSDLVDLSNAVADRTTPAHRPQRPRRASGT
jgi:transcriptional regulator with XRE-family HTH domain